MSAYTAEQAHAAVERGAKWLDKNCPTWFSEIDVELLNLQDPDTCVLGQTETCLAGPRHPNSFLSGYFRVLYSREIDWIGRWPALHGFNIPEPAADVSREEETARYEMLTIAWRELIHQRLEAPQ